GPLAVAVVLGRAGGGAAAVVGDVGLLIEQAGEGRAVVRLVEALRVAEQRPGAGRLLEEVERADAGIGRLHEPAFFEGPAALAGHRGQRALDVAEPQRALVEPVVLPAAIRVAGGDDVTAAVVLVHRRHHRLDGRVVL